MSKAHTNKAGKILLLGDSGSGKTFSAALLSKFKHVHFLFTENGMDTLNALPKEFREQFGKNITYQYVPASSSDLDTLLDQVNKINTLNYQSLADMPEQNKSKTNEFVQILKALKSPKDEFTGRELGSVDTWDSSRCLVIDSLSGIALASVRNVMGIKTVISPGQWNIIMQTVENFINHMCMALNCWVIVTAHPEREQDEVTGRTRVFASVPGKKLAPKIGRYFSEILETKYAGGKYLWSNVSDSIAIKRRVLPPSDSITPDWAPIIKGYEGQST